MLTTAAQVFAAHGVDLEGRSVVDVGCGPALPGIVSAKLGAARVVLCDKPSELALPRENAARNGVSVDVKPCWWGDDAMLEEMGQFDVVLVSDWYGIYALIECVLTLQLVPAGWCISTGPRIEMPLTAAVLLPCSTCERKQQQPVRSRRIDQYSLV